MGALYQALPVVVQALRRTTMADEVDGPGPLAPRPLKCRPGGTPVAFFNVVHIPIVADTGESDWRLK
jgi:hypothetical protein